MTFLLCPNFNVSKYSVAKRFQRCFTGIVSKEVGMNDKLKIDE